MDVSDDETLKALLILASPARPGPKVVSRLLQADVDCANLLKRDDVGVDALRWDDVAAADSLKRAQALLRGGEAAIWRVVEDADVAQAALAPRDEATRRRVWRGARFVPRARGGRGSERRILGGRRADAS